MKKRRTSKCSVLKRGILGIPLGITISYLISIVISLIWGQGYYAACVPELVEMMGNEIRAVVVQVVLSGFLGAVFGGASVIWEAEHWSIVKQTGIYFLIVAAAMLPVAYLTHWMEHSFRGILVYFGIFAAIFALVWLIQYARGRYMVTKMNQKLK